MNSLTADVDNLLKIGQLVKLYVGSADRLRKAGSTSDNKLQEYGSRIEEVLPEVVVVSWPSEREVQVPIAVGQDVILQVMSDKGILQLRSKVVATNQARIPALHISLCGNWSRTQQRRDVRITVTIVPYETILIGKDWSERDRNESGARAKFEGLLSRVIRAHSIDGTIHNVSAGGLLFATRAPLKLGDILRINFSLGRDYPDIAVLANVVRITENPAGRNGYELGCEFIYVRPSDQSNITKFIFKRQIELRQMGLT